MLRRKYLEAGIPNEVHADGDFFRIISCESTINVRATYGAEVVLESECRAGFNISTEKQFTRIELTSSTAQWVELWASKSGLSYNAPTEGSNHNQSFLIEHYGDNQKVLPFEVERHALTVCCDKPIWYGGAGVTPVNGIPIQPNTPTRIAGSGELHIAVNEPAEYTLSSNVAALSHGSLTKPDIDRVVSLFGQMYVLDGSDIYRLSATGFSQVNVADEFGAVSSTAIKSAVEYKGSIAWVQSDRVFYGHYKSAPTNHNLGYISTNGTRLIVTSEFKAADGNGAFSGNGMVWELNTDTGVFTKLLNAPHGNRLNGVFISREGDIFAQDYGAQTIYRLVDGAMVSCGRPQNTINSHHINCTEDDNFIIVNAYEGLGVIDKSTGLFVDKLPNASAAWIYKNSWYYISGTQVFESQNQGASWSLVYTHPSNISRPVIGFINNALIVTSFNGYSSPASYLQFVPEKKWSQPKVLIRALKEVY
ncbi:hypothetical protein [Pseudoalteromonas piscicida]|uniref:hypothetical protein n=1 Tax=Pseudoalteromonas piscicida TaxID=43662 RepID=UPI000E360020|nr:hypothetical protein [Pseudoalteromonas piscicida]AXQ97960.1 hypothetical protein D0N37_09475 [Pseudoalteromonas piscicida]